MIRGQPNTASKAALVLGVVLAAVAPVHAQDSVAAFFKGKTLRIVVGSGVGSGYDITARTLARYMTAYIPGRPLVIVQNQPGAGGITMTNSLYANGPFDGTAIGAPFNGTPTMPLLQPQSVRFNAARLIYLGSTNRETQVMYVWHTVPIHSLDEVKTKEVVMGAQAPGSTQYDYPVLLDRLLGYKFKVITGYESTPKIHLALERGEIQGTIANWSTLKALNANWIADKSVRLLVQWGLKKLPEIGDVPGIFDFLKTDADRAAVKLMVARLEFGRPFFLPPGVPADRIAALRRAFMATVKDPAFLADAAREKIDIDPLSGEEVQTLVADVSNTPPDVMARVRKALANR
jgi:tripartite-type tricarboxylate transporter receptor subunit TctC